MAAQPTLLLALDLCGTFVFALGGAWTALRAVRLDIVGVVTLGMVTAIGGGIVRDVLIGAVPPGTFGDWGYLAVATAGGVLAVGAGRGVGGPVGAVGGVGAAGVGPFAGEGGGKGPGDGPGPRPAGRP